jgi:hypothetical protein
MFLQNKYTNCYYRIIHRGQSRTLEGYSERHHIIPKSLGGLDDKSNLVDLTAREHFICHLLLRKMTTGKDRQKMICAVLFICSIRYSTINNRTFEKLKIEKSQSMRGINNPFYGKHHSPETRNIISMTHIGKKPYNFGLIMSKNQRIKISNSSKDKIISEITKIKMSHSKTYNKHPNNKYTYVLSNGQNYWSDLTQCERVHILKRFRIEQTDTIKLKRKKISVIRKIKA